MIAQVIDDSNRTVAGALIVAAFPPGATQILWVTPIAIWAERSGRKTTSIGLLAGLVFRLDAAYFGGMALRFGAESFQ